MQIVTDFIDKIKSTFADQETEEGIKKKIIEMHKNLRILRKKMWSEKNIAKRKSLAVEIKKYAEEKKNTEEKLINLVAKEFCYFGVGVDLNNIQNGLQVILIPWSDIQNHLLNIGTTRVGKTKFMLSNIRQAIAKGDNVVVIDPKGGLDQEILGSLVYFCSKAGRLKDFFYINPALPEVSLSFNPLFGMQDDEVASLIATLIYPVTTSENEFFGRYIVALLNQILSALTFLDMVDDPQKKIQKREERKELLSFILKRQRLLRNREKSNPKIEESIKKLEGELDKLEQESEEEALGRVPRSLITLKEISRYIEEKNTLRDQVESATIADMGDEHLSRLARKKKEEVLRLFKSTDNIGPEFHTKIAISLIGWINSFSTGTLGQLFCTTRINPIIQRIFDDNSGLVLLIHPLPLRFKKLSEDINKMVMKMFETSYGLVSLTGRGMGEKRTHFHFDEGESVLYVGIEGVLNKIAGLGGTVNIYTQSYADIDHKLSETISKIAQDNLNTALVMKVNDPNSVERSIALMGTRTMTRANFLQNSESVSSSYTNETVDLLKKEDIIKLGVGEAYLRNTGNIYKVVFPEMTDTMMKKVAIRSQSVEESYHTLADVENKILQDAQNIVNAQIGEREAFLTNADDL